MFSLRFRRLFLAAALLLVVCALPAKAAFQIDVRPGYGVTGRKWLSDDNPALRGTDCDTPVYVMEGKEPGGRALLFAGTHSREIAGPLSATILLENAHVTRGTLFVIPCLNVAGMSVPDTLGQVPHELIVQTKGGKRVLYYGDRRIPLQPGESDPPEFVHPTGYVHKDGAEWRNINRNYPGVADGTPAQRVCFGVMELIRREKIGTNLDVHEATAPESVLDPRDGKTYPGGTLSYSLITHPKYIDTAIEMIFDLEDRGVNLKAEQSIPGFRGISHYEIGEGTGCVPFLSETPNPAQNDHAVGIDPLNDAKHPIGERVAIQLEIFREWLGSCEKITGAPVVIEGLPDKKQIEESGVGAFLR